VDINGELQNLEGAAASTCTRNDCSSTDQHTGGKQALTAAA
jgi:hypothetical protein